MAVRNDTKRVEEVEEGVLCATILGYHAHNIKNMHHFCHAMSGHYTMSIIIFNLCGGPHPKRNKSCPLPTM